MSRGQEKIKLKIAKLKRIIVHDKN